MCSSNSSFSLTQIKSLKCCDSPRCPGGDEAHSLKWSSTAGHGVLLQRRPEEGEWLMEENSQLKLKNAVYMWKHCVSTAVFTGDFNKGLWTTGKVLNLFLFVLFNQQTIKQRFTVNFRKGVTAWAESQLIKPLFCCCPVVNYCSSFCIFRFLLLTTEQATNNDVISGDNCCLLMRHTCTTAN